MVEADVGIVSGLKHQKQENSISRQPRHGIDSQKLLISTHHTQNLIFFNQDTTKLLSINLELITAFFWHFGWVKKDNKVSVEIFASRNGQVETELDFGAS